MLRKNCSYLSFFDSFISKFVGYLPGYLITKASYLSGNCDNGHGLALPLKFWMIWPYPTPPSTINRVESAFLWRIGFTGAYSSESRYAWALLRSGNSIITILTGVQRSVSLMSSFPPLAR